MLTNTEYFREAAKTFEKYGYYTNAPKGSKEWRDFWRREQKRCLHGHYVGDTEITGYHYHYLNYWPIMKFPDDIAMSPEARKATSIPGRVDGFPAFWDGDYEFFWVIEIARHGIEEERYNNLNLYNDIVDLGGGKHVVVFKTRGRGYTYKVSSMLGRNYFHLRKSHNFALAHLDEFLIGSDGVLTKMYEGINFIDENTAWIQPRLDDKTRYLRNGKRKRIGGTYVERGRQNVVAGVTLKDNPEKGAGKRGDLVVYEEAGYFPGLKKAWDLNRPVIEQDGVAFGQQIAFGTGGADEKSFQDLNELFYNPEANNVIAMRNVYEEGMEDNHISLFIPDQWNAIGYMDRDGNSYWESAKEANLKEIERLKQVGSPADVDIYKSKHPTKPSDAALTESGNIFPTHDLFQRRKNVLAKNLYNEGVPGVLYRAEGSVKFKPSTSAKPIMDFPSKDSSARGAVVLYEAPYRDANGSIPNNMYIIGHDPYAHDEGSSLGAAYVFKNPNPYSQPDDIIVASWVGRPDTMDEYNDTLFKLAEFYNAQIGFENDVGDVLGYAKRHKKLHLLCPTPTLLTNRQPSSSSRITSRSYGISMNNVERKNNGILYFSQWLKQSRGEDDDGNIYTNIDEIYDPALLQEAIKFNMKGNYDRVMSCIVGMFFKQEAAMKSVATSSVDPRLEDHLQRLLGPRKEKKIVY